MTTRRFDPYAPPLPLTHGDVAEAVRLWLHIPFARIALKEIGLPNGQRIDVLAYEPKHNFFRLVECKASSKDVKNIPRQLMSYRQYADLLYVAVPNELVEEARELLPKYVGLLSISRVGSDANVVKNPRRVLMNDDNRRLMTARALTWLLAHFEKTKVCRSCGNVVPHGPA